MSAYVVSKETIDAIVTYAIKGRHRVGTCKRINGDRRPGEYAAVSDYTPDQIGQALWDENVRSVNYRYSEQSEFEVYKFSPCYKRPGKAGKYFSAIDIIKLCHCLDYQSCEHEAWEQSFAKDFLDRVEKAALREIPGYDEAPWGL